MNIVYAFSPNWFDYWEISCFSLFTNNPAPIKVYIMTDSLSQNQIDRIVNLKNLFGLGYEIFQVEVKDYIFNHKNLSFSKYALYRLLIPYYFNEERALYLDTDTVIQGSILDLYYLDFEDNLITGTIDYGIQNQQWVKDSIDFLPMDPYINSGVILFNIENCKKELITEKALEMVNSRTYTYPDQTILNKLTKEKVIYINKYYNFCNATKDGNPTELEDVKILHFAGFKINQIMCDMPFIGQWKIWEEKLRKSLPL